MSDSPPVRTTRWILAGAVVPALLAAALFEFLPLTGVSTRVLLALVASWLAAGAWRARATLRTPPYTILVPALFATSVAIAALAVLLAKTDRSMLALAGAVGPTLAGWAIFLWLLGHPERDAPAATWEPPRWAPWVLVGGAALLLTTVHWLASGQWARVSDEVVYLVQSAWMRPPRYGWRVDADLLPFLLARKYGVTPDGAIYGMYTPGWPALLALFDAVGLRWWSGVILGTGTVYVTYRLGAHLHSRTAGLVGGGLLALQPLVLMNHAGYMAHPATTFCVALAALWLLQGEEGSGRARDARWLGAGALLAVAVTVRPLTGVALGCSLAAWLVLRRRLPLPALVRCAALVVVGAAPIAAWLLHYNWVTNGEALRVSYQALHGDGYNLGFGVRGFTVLDEQLRRVRFPIVFTPRDAVTSLVQRLAAANYNFVPYALLAPLLAALAAHRHRPRWPVLAAFLILPALYFFYWGTALRFYSELLPLLYIWIAAGCLAIAQARPRLGTGLLAAMLVSSVVLALPGRWGRVPLDSPWLRSAYTSQPGRLATLEQLDSLRRAEGRLLVFVRERMPKLDALIDQLFQFNQHGLDSDVLVVRDRGAENAALMARFRDRVPLLVIDRGPAVAAPIVRLSPTAASPPP